VPRAQPVRPRRRLQSVWDQLLRRLRPSYLRACRRLRRCWNSLIRALPRRPRSLGQRGERAACRYLRRLGYHIVERGARPRYGEIDIVAVDDRVIVFVEVKTRTSPDAGYPAEAVDARKQQRLTRAARLWLKRHRLAHLPARFDVLAVTWPPGQRRPDIEHFRNAFEAADDA
jgi:putative endonuclease